MVNSPTGNPADTSTGVTDESQNPTGNEQQTNTAEQNQETNSREQSQGSVSDDTAQQNQNQNGDGQQTQTEEQGGDSTADDGLAKFAKSQGVDDITGLDDNAQRFLKIAYDNQKAFRNSKNEGQRINDTSKTLQGDGQSLESRVQEMEYERTTDKFWSGENRDRSLESSMVEILHDKVETLTPMLGEDEAKKYAFNLSRDLDTLYGMAQLKNGAKPGQNVDAEAIRREERESIKKAMTAGAPNAHAVESQPAKNVQVTDEWIRDVYNPRDPEHIEIMQKAGLR